MKCLIPDPRLYRCGQICEFYRFFEDLSIFAGILCGIFDSVIYRTRTIINHINN